MQSISAHGKRPRSNRPTRTLSTAHTHKRPDRTIQLANKSKPDHTPKPRTTQKEVTMPTITEQTLTVHDLYAMRDNIGLSRKECKQPPRTRSLFEWDRGSQGYYLNSLKVGLAIPPVVYIWEPVDGSGKGAVLDGRQRLKAIFSYLDGNFRRREIAPGEWIGKDYIQLLATNPHLAETLLQTPIQVVTIQAPSYWEAAITVYPQICGHTRETVELEQQMLMHYLDDYGLDYRDPDCNIFTDKEYCDWEVSNLKMGLARQKRIEFRYTGLRVPVPQLPPREFSKITEWQIRATEFVARHHHRGVISC